MNPVMWYLCTGIALVVIVVACVIKETPEEKQKRLKQNK